MLHQLTSFHARCRKLFRRSKTSQEAKPEVPVSVNNWTFFETSFLIFEVVSIPLHILNLPTHFQSSQPFIHQKKLPAMLVALILSLPLLHTMMMMFLCTTWISLHFRSLFYNSAPHSFHHHKKDRETINNNKCSGDSDRAEFLKVKNTWTPISVCSTRCQIGSERSESLPIGVQASLVMRDGRPVHNWSF